VACRVALNFCGSLILQSGVFLCFAGTNFCDWKCAIFGKSRSNGTDNIFVFYLSTCNRNTDKTTWEGKTDQGRTIRKVVRGRGWEKTKTKIMQGKMSEKKIHARENVRKKIHAQDRPHFDMKP